MRVCPLCNGRYEDDVRKCPYDGRRPLSEQTVRDGGGDVLLGATIAGRYTILGKLGAGGMGTVYRAEQAPIEREVALKVLRKDLGRDPETAARFHREAHTLSQLKHPNTVAIIDFGQTEDGLLFLAMELLEGEMLSVRMKRTGPFDVLLAIRVASGVLRSLGEAHARGIIHRDLKPDNIFLARVHGRADEAEVVKVVDFGIAKIRDGDSRLEPLQTQEGTVFGTPRYMSPEQAQGKPLDGRSDLYAVGVLLFHMLTGRAPFTDDDAVVVMAHHIKTIPPPVRTVVPDRAIPESLERLVQKALLKSPSSRLQTAEQFLEELEVTLEDAKALAALLPANGTQSSTPPPSPVVYSTQKKLTKPTVVGVGVAATITAAALLLLGGRKPSATTDTRAVHAAASTRPPESPQQSPTPVAEHPTTQQQPEATGDAGATTVASNSADAGTPTSPELATNLTGSDDTPENITPDDPSTEVGSRRHGRRRGHTNAHAVVRPSGTGLLEPPRPPRRVVDPAAPGETPDDRYHRWQD